MRPPFRARTVIYAVVTAVAAMIPVVAGRNAAVAAGELTFPRPGGGPMAIHALSDLTGTQTYLLDLSAGVYRPLPFVAVHPSPDERLAAVEDIDGRIGVAERTVLLRSGAAAVRWTTLPPGSLAGWSPDGQALLSTTLDKSTRTFTAHRYDVANGRLRHTPIRMDCDTCTAGRAGDSIRYTVMLRGADPDVPIGPARYLNPDGSPGSLVGVDGMIWSATSYSPSRRYVVVEPPRPLDSTRPARWHRPKIFDLQTGTAVAAIDTDWPIVGWYDEQRIVRVAPGASSTVLDVVDIYSGRAVEQVPAPGLPPYKIDIGPSTLLTGTAAQLGF